MHILIWKRINSEKLNRWIMQEEKKKKLDGFGIFVLLCFLNQPHPSTPAGYVRVADSWREMCSDCLSCFALNCFFCLNFP